MIARLLRGTRSPAARAVIATLAVVSATVVAVWWSTDRPRPPWASTDAVRLGVPPGSSVEEYVARTRRDLATVDDAGGYALVTFDRYVLPAELPDLLAGTVPVSVLVRVPLPGGEPTEILRLPAASLPGDVLAGMDRVAARKEREAADPARDGTLADLSAAEAALLRSHCGCVYAALVRSSGPQLVTLGVREAVRAVEVTQSVVDPGRAVLLPPLPEQSTIALPPSGR